MPKTKAPERDPDYVWSPAPVVPIDAKVERWLQDHNLVANLIASFRELEAALQELETENHKLSMFRASVLEEMSQDYPPEQKLAALQTLISTENKLRGEPHTPQ